jgi:hypothetical protein
MEGVKGVMKGAEGVDGVEGVKGVEGVRADDNAHRLIVASPRSLISACVPFRCDLRPRNQEFLCLLHPIHLRIRIRNVHKSLFGYDLMQVFLRANATFALFFCRLLRSIRQPQRRQRPARHKSYYFPRINHSVQTRTTRSHRRRSYLRGSSSLKT